MIQLSAYCARLIIAGVHYEWDSSCLATCGPYKGRRRSYPDARNGEQVSQNVRAFMISFTANLIVLYSNNISNFIGSPGKILYKIKITDQ